MKLKYYLRGIGIGVVITTILFMISISLHKNDETQNTPELNTESKTVAEVENSTQEAENVDMEASEQPEDTKKETEVKKDTKTKNDTEIKNETNTESQNNTKKETEAETQQEETPETQSKSEQTEKVRFEIKGGEFSDVVCRKLAEAGLVDSAESFNKFLVEKDYDNGILPGVYDIPKDSTYEEIAILLTTKI